MSTEPADRNDEIGMLARRLVGITNPDQAPDWTAAQPLIDLLIQEGDLIMAYQIRTEIGAVLNMLAENQAAESDPRIRQQLLRSMQGGLQVLLLPLFFDIGSACGFLTEVTHRMAKPQQIQTGKVELNTVRMQVPEHSHIGMHVQLEDGEQGVVVSARDSHGMADVIPAGSGLEAYVEGSMVRPGFAQRMPNGRLIMRRPW